MNFFRKIIWKIVKADRYWDVTARDSSIKALIPHKGFKRFKKIFDVRCKRCGSDYCVPFQMVTDNGQTVKQKSYDTLVGMRCAYCGSRWCSDLSVGKRYDIQMKGIGKRNE